MSAVQDYIYEQDFPNQAILQFLHDFIMAENEVICKIRYRVPFYYRRSWLCYLNPVKPKGIELNFIRGNELSNANGLLDFRGRSQVAGIIYRELKDIKEEPLMELLQEALLLDETVKYKSKRKG